MSKIEYKKGFELAIGSVSLAFIPFNEGDRLAKCMYCDRPSQSDPVLPFFKAKPNEEYDEYYCGCRGWD